MTNKKCPVCLGGFDCKANDPDYEKCWCNAPELKPFIDSRLKQISGAISGCVCKGCLTKPSGNIQ